MKKKYKMLIIRDPDLFKLFEEIVRAKHYLKIEEDFPIESERDIPNAQATIWGMIEKYTKDIRNLKILELYNKKIRGD